MCDVERTFIGLVTKIATLLNNSEKKTLEVSSGCLPSNELTTAYHNIIRID